jgi:magnesium transporter
MGEERVLGTIVEGVATTVERLERDTSSLAELVLSPTRLYRVERLYDLLKEAMNAGHTLAVTEPTTRHHGPEPADLEPLRARLRHVRDDLGLLLQAHQTRSQTLQAQVHARQAEIGTRQNDDMRKISAWAAIVAVPTLITGVYGMNFESMPELGWAAGYPVVISAIVGISVALYAYFRRIKWL